MDRAVTVHGVLAEVDVADETAVIRHHGYHLRVLTNLLRPFRFRLLSKYRFVGELRRVAAVCPKPGGESCKDGPETVQADDCWLLHARVYQCIDGLVSCRACCSSFHRVWRQCRVVILRYFAQENIRMATCACIRMRVWGSAGGVCRGSWTSVIMHAPMG